MRLFIACELPDAVRQALAGTSAALRDSVEGRYVAPDSFHVTLAFLGDVPGSRIPALSRILDEACQGTGSIPVALGALGSFGRKRSATLWQAFADDSQLKELASRIRMALSDDGFFFDEKEFRAHITLMRAANISEGVLPMPEVEAGIIERVSLFSSDLSGKRPIYEAIHTVELDS